MGIATLLAIGAAIWTTRVASLMRSVANDLGSLLLLGAIVCLVLLARCGRFTIDLRVLAVVTTVAAAPFLLLPPDWMGEYRFATPFLPLVHLLLADVFARCATDVSRRHAVMLRVLLSVVVGTMLAIDAWRLRRFTRAPTVPLASVVDTYTKLHARSCEILGPAHASIMDVDLGGLLWASRQRVYDLGMLCDRTVARTLGRDRVAFHAYVFATIKPTLLHVHGEASVLARFDADPRFRRDYTPIHERPSLLPDLAGDGPAFDGFYVRCDALRDPAMLSALRTVR